jgi:hypothetical protein
VTATRTFGEEDIVQTQGRSVESEATLLTKAKYLGTCERKGLLLYDDSDGKEIERTLDTRNTESESYQ